MKFWTTLLITGFIFIQQLSSQPLCEYIPLEFEEIEPIWRHLCIDSTFIGHTDTSAETGQNINEYFDGMDQLLFDGGSFIDQDFLYSCTQVEYDLDLAGYFIEKIDLLSGKKIWTIKTDLRTSEKREFVYNFSVTDDKFIMYGHTPILDELLIFTPYLYTLGLLPSLYFERTYDNHTGELLDSFFSHNMSDPDLLELKSRGSLYKLYTETDSTYRYFELDSDLLKGTYLTSTLMDKNGLKVSKKDSVVTSIVNNMSLDSFKFQAQGNFTKWNDNYFFLQAIYNEFEPHKSFVQINLFSNEFITIDSLILDNSNSPPFSNISIMNVVDKFIILEGCLQENPNAFCESYFIVLDTSLNIKYSLEGSFNEIFVGDISDFKLTNENKLIFINQTFYESGNSNLNIYKINSNNSLDSIFRLTIMEPEWVAFVEGLFILPDGDLLIKFTHSCYEDGRKNSWHPEWQRLDFEDLNYLTNILHNTDDQLDLLIYPNPADNRITIDVNDQDLKITLYDMQGKLLLQSNNNMIDVSGLDPGIYNVKIQIAHELRTVFKKLVVR